MTRWICARCAVEYPDSVEPPGGCLICIDERECVEPPGQRWTTLADLERDGHHGSLREVEPRLFGIKVEPTVGIGQQALLIGSSGGNLLWDPTGYLDDDLVDAVSAAGGVAAIAASHPHMFGVQVEWSHRFNDGPVHVNRADRLYDNFGGRVGPGAAGRVRRSAERYIGWVRGDHDNLTTVR